jgi:hypothetical protein
MRSFASPRQQRLVPQRTQPGYISYEDLRDVEQSSLPYMSPMTDPAGYMMTGGGGNNNGHMRSTSRTKLLSHSPSKDQYMMPYDSRGFETVSAFTLSLSLSLSLSIYLSIFIAMCKTRLARLFSF